MGSKRMDQTAFMTKAEINYGCGIIKDAIERLMADPEKRAEYIKWKESRIHEEV